MICSRHVRSQTRVKWGECFFGMTIFFKQVTHSYTFPNTGTLETTPPPPLNYPQCRQGTFEKRPKYFHAFLYCFDIYLYKNLILFRIKNQNWKGGEG